MKSVAFLLSLFFLTQSTVAFGAPPLPIPDVSSCEDQPGTVDVLQEIGKIPREKRTSDEELTFSVLGFLAKKIEGWKKCTPRRQFESLITLTRWAFYTHGPRPRSLETLNQIVESIDQSKESFVNAARRNGGVATVELFESSPLRSRIFHVNFDGTSFSLTTGPLSADIPIKIMVDLGPGPQIDEVKSPTFTLSTPATAAESEILSKIKDSAKDLEGMPQIKEILRSKVIFEGEYTQTLSASKWLENPNTRLGILAKLATTLKNFHSLGLVQGSFFPHFILTNSEGSDLMIATLRYSYDPLRSCGKPAHLQFDAPQSYPPPPLATANNRAKKDHVQREQARDVFAFGIMALKSVSPAIQSPGERCPVRSGKSDRVDCLQRIMPTFQDEITKWARQACGFKKLCLEKLIADCLKSEPDHRPTAQVIQRKLMELITQYSQGAMFWRGCGCRLPRGMAGCKAEEIDIYKVLQEIPKSQRTPDQLIFSETLVTLAMTDPETSCIQRTFFADFERYIRYLLDTQQSYEPESNYYEFLNLWNNVVSNHGSHYIDAKNHLGSGATKVASIYTQVEGVPGHLHYSSVAGLLPIRKDDGKLKDKAAFGSDLDAIDLFNQLRTQGVDLTGLAVGTRFGKYAILQKRYDSNLTVYPILEDSKRRPGVLYQVALGLRVLHSAGRVHGDLKAPNILTTYSGEVGISDFGLLMDPSKLIQSKSSPDIEAPEMWNCRDLEKSDDFKFIAARDSYAFGILGVESYPQFKNNIPWMKCGQLNDKGQWEVTDASCYSREAEQLYNDFSKVAEAECMGKNPDTCVAMMILKCLHLDPYQRPTAEELVRGMGEAMMDIK